MPTLLRARSGALGSFFQIIVLLFLLQEKFDWSKLVTAIPVVAAWLTIITAASRLKKEPKADGVPRKGVDEDEYNDQ